MFGYITLRGLLTAWSLKKPLTSFEDFNQWAMPFHNLANSANAHTATNDDRACIHDRYHKLAWWDSKYV